MAEFETDKAAALYVRYVGMATLLADAMVHVKDDAGLEYAAMMAYLDMSKACPELKITKTGKRFNVATRSDDEAA